MIDDDKITAILERDPDSASACDSLITAALDAGGKDNVTVVVAGYTVPEAS